MLKGSHATLQVTLQKFLRQAEDLVKVAFEQMYSPEGMKLKDIEIDTKLCRTCSFRMQTKQRKRFLKPLPACYLPPSPPQP